ncbi:hypothetical protein [Streptomyces sp. NPDC088246]|uniref:hypothetical protein n=1 Tax=Streptomyces sp. NPDC088246 TaxID=3365842 RepID=UPI0038229284
MNHSSSSVYNQSYAYGDGEMTSTVDDLERCTAALFAGRLLPARLLRRMFTLPPEHVRMLGSSSARYSMGLQTATVNGVTFWGKTGKQYGNDSGMFSTLDGQRRLAWSYSPVAGGPEQQRTTKRIVTALT